MYKNTILSLHCTLYCPTSPSAKHCLANLRHQCTNDILWFVAWHVTQWSLSGNDHSLSLGTCADDTSHSVKPDFHGQSLLKNTTPFGISSNSPIVEPFCNRLLPFKKTIHHLDQWVTHSDIDIAVGIHRPLIGSNGSTLHRGLLAPSTASAPFVDQVIFSPFCWRLC